MSTMNRRQTPLGRIVGFAVLLRGIGMAIALLIVILGAALSGR